jgi:putative lipoprotein
MTRRTLFADALVVGLLLGAARCRPAPEKSTGITPSTQSISQATGAGLGGTSWRLVRFEGGDGLTLTPDDKAKYTLALGTDGRLSTRIDCNRGSGTWKSTGSPQLEFGPLALTRAKCPSGSLHDRIVKHWPYVRSYVIKDGHLFVSLMADGGIYEFEPAGSDASLESAVKGTATYRERMALPRDAVLEATLEDVSGADAAADVIGQTRVEDPGNPPIRFEIRYDPSRIDPSRRYAVRARIMVGGKPFFTTDQHYPVLTAGKGNEVKLLLRRAVASGAATESLENTYWKLTHLGDAPVPVASRQAEPHLIINSVARRVGGSGGCNRLTGSYELKGDRLSLGPATTTLMACADGMETEEAFLEALGRVNGWRVAGKQLELLDTSGRVLARFEARHME